MKTLQSLVLATFALAACAAPPPASEPEGSSVASTSAGAPAPSSSSSQTGGTPPGGSSAGGTTGTVAIDPTLLAACNAAGANDQGVGKACTAGGGQCTGAADTCSADYESSPINLCTSLCDATTACGADAVCAPNPLKAGGAGPWLCLRSACVAGGKAAGTPPSKSACLPPSGNDMGVGKPCTAGGNQCSGLKASSCSVDLYAAAPLAYCTVALCTSDAGCGSGARCVPGPGTLSNFKICLPTSCLP